MDTKINAVLEAMDASEEYSRKDVQKLCGEVHGLDLGDAYALMRKVCKELINVRRGFYMVANSDSAPTQADATIQNSVEKVVDMPKPKVAPKPIVVQDFAQNLVPEKVSEYVAWGNFSKIKKIVQSRQFIPTFVTGLSGNGKTMMINQACASLKRELVRVQITPETDEDDLIGGFRLVDGETVFEKGPVVTAMERGAILLLDEIDRGSNRLMALQGVLEGEPILLKKTKELITPAEGFNVIATGNTKGQGSEDGKFIAATVIDEAFLERFTLTIEQVYATEAVEKNILRKHMSKFDVSTDEGFVERLVMWAGSIRKLYTEGEIEEVITTRRLCHIIQTYSIFENEVEAVELCLARFDADTASVLKDYYTKLVAAAEKQEETPEVEQTVSEAWVADDNNPYGN